MTVKVFTVNGTLLHYENINATYGPYIFGMVGFIYMNSLIDVKLASHVLYMYVQNVIQI